MRTIKNVSPVGDLSIPSLRLEIPAGGEVELVDDVAARLLEQTENFIEIKPASAGKKPTASAKTTTAEEI